MLRDQAYARLLSTGAPAPLATITVYDPPGQTTTLATIYADDLAAPTPLANPFTADQYGAYFFYMPEGSRVDVRVAPAAAAGPTYTLGDQWIGSNTRLQGYARASLPTVSASSPGRLARVTDNIRGVWFDTGVQWLSLAGEIANVKEFGARGNNSANDTAAIQAAIDAVHANASGGTVYFPPGIYLVDTLTWYTNVTLQGSGTVGITTGDPIGTQLRSRSAVPLLQQLGTTLDYQRGVLRDLTLDGNTLGTIGIDLKNLAWFFLDHVFVYNFTQIGLRLRGCLTCQFSHCQVRNCVIGVQGNQSVEVAGLGGNLVTFRDCQIGSNSSYGLTWQHGGLLRLDGCDVSSNGTAGNAATGGLMVSNMAIAGEGVALVIDGCWFENNSGHSGVRIDPATFSTNLHIIRGTHIFSGTRTYGLAITGGAISTVYLAEGIVCQNAGTQDIVEGANVFGTLLGCQAGALGAGLSANAIQIPRLGFPAIVSLFGTNLIVP